MGDTVGHGARGGTHAEAIEASNLIFLDMYPGDMTLTFLDRYRSELSGRGKMFVDVAAPYYHGPDMQPPIPHESSLPWLKDYLGDPTASWASTFKSMGWESVRDNKAQPIEICGDEHAKAVVMQLLSAAGWKPLDCGGVQHAPLLEPCGPKRRKHPRIEEYDAKHG